MPLSFRQAGNLFVAGPNIGIYPSGNGYAISGSSSASTSLQTISTIGSGTFSIASSFTNNRLVYKTLSAGTGISIIDSGTGTLTFSATPQTIGTYVSAVTSAGTGNILIFSSNTGSTLVQKSISGGTGISIIESNDGTLLFSSTTSSIGTIISGTNRGTGVNFFQGLQTTTNPNDTLGFYNLLQGDNVGIIINDNGEIEINRGGTVVSTLSNQGGGAKIYSGITGSTIIARTIQASTSGITTSLVNNTNVTGATSAITASTLVRIAPTNATANLFYFSNASGIMTAGVNHGVDSTVGTLAIGIAAVTNTRLLIAAGTGAISHMRLTPFAAAYSGASNGDIWYNSASGNSLFFNKGTSSPTPFIFKDNNYSFSGTNEPVNRILETNSGGTLSTTRYINSFGIFNALSTVTISNTASETSIISSVLTGSTTLLASTKTYNPELVVGRKFRFIARGILGFDVTPVELNIIIKLGSTIISSSSTISIGLFDIPTSLEFDIESTFTVRNSGLIVGSGKIIFSTPPSTIGGDPVIFGIYSQNQTITTTTNQVFDCTAQFDVADPTNSITIYESTLEILN